MCHESTKRKENGKNVLTGSFPSIASIHSFRLDSEKACSVMIPGLSKHTYTLKSLISSQTVSKVRIQMHIDMK